MRAEKAIGRLRDIGSTFAQIIAEGQSDRDVFTCNTSALRALVHVPPRVIN